MQDKKNEQKKNKLKKLLGKKVKELRTQKSQTMFAYESGISSSIVSPLERGIKDPQFTTLWKLAEALNMPLSEFIKLIEQELPDNWHLLEK